MLWKLRAERGRDVSFKLTKQPATRWEPARRSTPMLKLVHSAHEDSDKTPEDVDLDELCRLAARRLPATALFAELQAYLDACFPLLEATGKRTVVANVSAKERNLATGAGQVEVKAPHVDDRGRGERYRSGTLPVYMRKSPKVAEVLPLLYQRVYQRVYQRGLAIRDFVPALAQSWARSQGFRPRRYSVSPSPDRPSTKPGATGKLPWLVRPSTTIIDSRPQEPQDRRPEETQTDDADKGSVAT